MKEILLINVGQAGINIGDKTWQTFIRQHDINPNGNKASQNNTYNDHSIFNETQAQKFIPRNIFVDTDPQRIDQLKKGWLKDLYKPSSYICTKQDSSNNYIRGNYTIGKEIIDQTLDQVRKCVQSCENFQGIIVNAALAGGTGSGFTNLLLSRLQSQQILKKKSTIMNVIFPSPHFSDTVVQPYNVIQGLADFHENSLQKLINCFDNEKMYQICQQNGIDQPGFNEINELTAQSISLLTHHFRQKPNIHSISELQNNLVPYRHLCFMQPNIYKTNITQVGRSINFLQALWSDRNSLSSYGRNSLSYQKVSFGMSTILRGSIFSFDALQSFQKHKKNLTWIQWCKTGFKLFANPNGEHTSSHFVQGLNLANNNNMLDILKRQHKKYDSLFQRRVFVHWYVGEGIEDEDFSSKREYTRYLQRDYQQSSIILDADSDNDDSCQSRQPQLSQSQQLS